MLISLSLHDNYCIWNSLDANKALIKELTKSQNQVKTLLGKTEESKVCSSVY